MWMLILMQQTFLFDRPTGWTRSIDVLDLTMQHVLFLFERDIATTMLRLSARLYTYN